MLPALILLLLSAGAPANPADTRFPEAVEIFHSLFDVNSDKDFDGWPDGWTRQKGPEYPSYTKIRIQPEASPGGENCLRIDLDGGGAAVFTPPIPVNISYGYIAEAYLRTEGLKRDDVFISLTFLDADKHTVSSAESEKVTESGGWKKIHLGTVETSNPQVHFMVVGLHVEPGSEADLLGTVSFSDIWLGRLPRMEVKTNHPHNFFLDPTKATVTCTASGLDDRFSEVDFELFDVHGESVSKETLPLVLQPPDVSRNHYAESPDYAADWTPKLPYPGFYRVRLRLKGKSPTADRREITLVSIEPRLLPPQGIFGWSLTQGARPWTLAELPPLLEQAGVNWVKYPLWCSEDDGGRQVERILQFCEKMSNMGIEMVGILAQPPEPIREKFGKGPLTAAKIFDSDPKNWYPSLEPVMIQLSNRIRYWQLGSDTDLSLLVLPNYIEKLKAIRTEFDRSMQGIELGIGWDWSQSLPSGPKAAELPWNFVSISSDPPPTSEELGKSLDAVRASPLKSWVVLSLPARGEQPMQKRAEDLIGRMIAAKIHGARAVFFSNPFDPKCGLMNADGTPGELLIPWRTAATEIGGAEFIGEMMLPHGSQNQVFLREKDAVMYLWNRKHVEELVNLGGHVKQISIWGRATDVPELDRKQLLEVDPQPSFITGISKPIAQWSVGVQIEKPQLASHFGQPQANSFSVKNSFPEVVKGKATIACPKSWAITPQSMNFFLQPGETLTYKFNVILTSLASLGRNIIRIDFEIQGDQVHQFSIYRALDVRSGDVRIEVQTRLNDKNELEVEQRFLNESEKTVNFSCELTVPGRRLLATQVLRQSPGENIQVYKLEDGQSLLGQTLLLHAAEIDGSRILNYRFEAEK
jgi:hypothetical protein